MLYLSRVESDAEHFPVLFSFPPPLPYLDVSYVHVLWTFFFIGWSLFSQLPTKFEEA